MPEGQMRWLAGLPGDIIGFIILMVMVAENNLNVSIVVNI